jgi:hypothetical protein
VLVASTSCPADGNSRANEHTTPHPSGSVSRTVSGQDRPVLGSRIEPSGVPEHDAQPDDSSIYSLPRGSHATGKSIRYAGEKLTGSARSRYVQWPGPGGKIARLRLSATLAGLSNGVPKVFAITGVVALPDPVARTRTEMAESQFSAALARPNAGRAWSAGPETP